jgi:hypothetical protein
MQRADRRPSFYLRACSFNEKNVILFVEQDDFIEFYRNGKDKGVRVGSKLLLIQRKTG